MAVPLLNIH